MKHEKLDIGDVMNSKAISIGWLSSVGCKFTVQFEGFPEYDRHTDVVDVNGVILGRFSLREGFRQSLWPQNYRPRFRVKAPSIPTHEVIA